MVRGTAGRARTQWRHWCGGIVLALVSSIAGAVIAFGPAGRFTALSVILAVAAVGAGFLSVSESDGLGASGGFVVIVLAAGFLGTASAVGIALIVELTAAIVTRTRWQTVVFCNLTTVVGAAAVAPAVIIHALAPRPEDTAVFYLAVTLAEVVSLVLSFFSAAGLKRLVFPTQKQFGLGDLVRFGPSAGITILVTAAGVGIVFKLGNAGIAFALAGVFAFSYMAHLLEQSRGRAQAYASLSWGVLAGLMRSLDIRDQRAARHSAAVARFARDIAAQVGMDAQQCELAHTAGLLHDIGRFALSDRVAERGRTLTEEDWAAIQRHPELGADMLRDLGSYGPVAEIVLAHHERIDGRGYPFGLTGEEIPEIAKIISVAEVYDTLTASDTYRTRMSSFEALRELRRVSGSQLDGGYVEVLAALLSGEGVDYRHADMVSFDSELDIERRIREAAAGA